LAENVSIEFLTLSEEVPFRKGGDESPRRKPDIANKTLKQKIKEYSKQNQR